LVPTLQEGDIVIMDNLGSHKGNKIQRAIRTVGARLLFLPPCSPDSRQAKALLRKAEERTLEALWRRIGSLLDAFSPAECTNYFRNCGYGSR
jgi:transposase